jgi:hypothetical protein
VRDLLLAQAWGELITVLVLTAMRVEAMAVSHALTLFANEAGIARVVMEVDALNIHPSVLIKV